MAVLVIGAVALAASDCQANDGTALEPVESLVAKGFEESDVVMLNDVHDGALRNRRSRAQMIKALDAARELGVRFVAMEALAREVADVANSTRTVPTEGGPYLDQDDMRAVMQHALEAGYTLVAYEPRFDREAPPELQSVATTDLRVTNWREEAQASNLASFLGSQPPKTKLLVFPGLGHLYERGGGGWTPMAVVFNSRTGIDPFTIDQSVTADIGPPSAAKDVSDLEGELRALGGTGGFLRRDDPNRARRDRRNVDAYLLSLENALD